MEFATKCKIVKPARNDDIVYDKILEVPGPKDYNKEVDKSIKNSLQFKLCSNYSQMFSNENERNYWTVKNVDKLPINVTYDVWRQQQKITNNRQRNIDHFDLTGTHRSLFFRQPIPLTNTSISSNIKLKSAQLTSQNINEQEMYEQQQQQPQQQPMYVSVKSIMKDSRRKSLLLVSPASRVVEVMNKSTQTDYRESECQTLPCLFEPEYSVMENLELTSLFWVNWGENTTTSIDEVERIERARQMKLWRMNYPEAVDTKSTNKRKQLVESMAHNDTSYDENREEILNKLRLCLSASLLHEERLQLEKILDGRLERLRTRKKEQNEEKLQYIYKTFLRETRKVNMKEKKITKKYQKCDIVNMYNDRTSELYAPQLRFGENPSRRNEIIDIQCRFLKRFRGLEILQEQTVKSPQVKSSKFDYEKASKSKKNVELCVRVTNWSEDGLSKLHTNIKSNRYKRSEHQDKQVIQLKTRRPLITLDTEQVEEVDPVTEERYQAAVLLSKLIKGRNIQSQMFVNRQRLGNKTYE